MLTLMVTGASFAQLSYGVQGMGNLSDAKVKYEGDYSSSKKMKVQPGAGIVAQYAFSKTLALRSGIGYLQHGVKLTFNRTSGDPAEPTIKGISTMKLNYVQVPVNILYTHSLLGLEIFAGGGGFINYGIGGQVKSNATISYGGVIEEISSETKPFKSGDDGENFKKADVGVSAIAGVKFSNGLFANLGYQLSLTNSVPKAEDGKYKNRGLQLTIGFLF